MSFCTGTGQVAEDGLLSQWRAYGRQGGYAIVFDTAELDKLLAAEKSLWHLDLFGGDVVYSDATDDQVRAEIGAELEAIKRSIGGWLTTGGRDEHLEEIYYPLIWCACRYKHWGFREEKEVRIVAIPPNAEILAELAARGSPVKQKPLHHFTRGKRLVPTVHLFESLTHLPKRPLPIRRIIVGPGDDREQRQLALSLLIRELDLDIPITVSAIPYVDRSDD